MESNKTVAQLANVHTYDDCPDVGDTQLSAKIVGGSVVAVDQHGKIIKGLTSAVINSEMGKITKMTVTVIVRIDND